MRNRLLGAMSLVLAIILSGCATPTKMAFEDDAEKITEDSKPIFLLTATVKNSYRPSYQPKVFVLHVEKPEAKEAADRLNFKIDEKAKMEGNTQQDGNTYFLRLPLEKGNYKIVGFSSIGASFPIHGFYFTPLHSQVESKKGGVFYLGHVSANVRERQGDEFRAGPLLPLIDQSLAGASGGTFDVEISDRLITDEPIFRSRFPALKGVEIVKAILPPFDREAAQKYWDAH